MMPSNLVIFQLSLFVLVMTTAVVPESTEPAPSYKEQVTFAPLPSPCVIPASSTILLLSSPLPNILIMPMASEHLRSTLLSPTTIVTVKKTSWNCCPSTTTKHRNRT